MNTRLIAALITVGLPGAALMLPAEPMATGATDPCAASEVARTVGSVAKQTGDYLDSHPETNQAMTAALQAPAGPESLGSLKSYFDRNPKAAGELQAISQPLSGLSAQCKLPVSIPHALTLAQAAQGVGGLPGLPAGGLPAAAAAPPAAAGPLPGPIRGNHAG